MICPGPWTGASGCGSGSSCERRSTTGTTAYGHGATAAFGHEAAVARWTALLRSPGAWEYGLVELRGVVHEWRPAEGFGFIDGADGNRYWTHFMYIVTGTGFAELSTGQQVRFTADGYRQDGFLRAQDVAVEGESVRVR